MVLLSHCLLLVVLGYNSGKDGREINHLCFITMHGFIFLLVCIYKWKGTRLKQGRETDTKKE
jgi:hypothetical protein